MLGLTPTTSRISSKDRRQLAGLIRSALQDASAPRPLLRGFRPLIRRNVVLACADALARTATSLEDASVTLDLAAVRSIRRFVTDGAISPLYGHDASAARTAAVRLAEELRRGAVATEQRRGRKPRLIVHATDGSPQANEATEAAFGFCRESGAQLAVVSVRTVRPGGKGMAPAIYATESIEGTKQISDSVVSKARALGIDATAYLRAGNPSKEIASLADELDADMIVVGTRGHGSLRSALSGSVSHDLIKRAHVPVTVLHETNA